MSKASTRSITTSSASGSFDLLSRKAPRHNLGVPHITRFAPTSTSQDGLAIPPSREALPSPPRAVFLDRDGTLIDFHRDAELGAVVSAFHPNQLRLLPGVVEGLRLLHEAGYRLAIATNQPGPAKGQVSQQAIDRTNQALVALLEGQGIPIVAVAACYHHPEGGEGGDPMLARKCECRKPAPGLLLALARELLVDIGNCWMIGDTASDIEAATRAGCRSALLIDSTRCELCPVRDAIATKPISPNISAPRLDVLSRLITQAG